MSTNRGLRKGVKLIGNRCRGSGKRHSKSKIGIEDLFNFSGGL